MPSLPSAETLENLKLIVMDVDGVLTDGKLIYFTNGVEGKAFDVKDGLGISLGVLAGLEFGIITARESLMVSQRAEELDIKYVYQNTRIKLPVLQQLLNSLQLPAEQVAYIGDDLPDISCMKAVGFAACPADAVKAVRDSSHFVSVYPGGNGAVREIIEFIIQANPERNARIAQAMVRLEAGVSPTISKAID